MAAQGIKDLNLEDAPPAPEGNDDPQDIDMEEEEEKEEEEGDANPTFALTPGHITQGVLDYSMSEGRKIYYKAVQPLLDEPYLAQPDQLGNFLNAVDDRAREYGWHGSVGGILHIPEDPDKLITKYDDFIARHGIVSLTRVRQAEEAYIDTPSRAAQDTTMLYYAIINSLSSSARNKIMIWRDQFTIGKNRSGVALLKVLIRESHLDTNATTTSIRTKLSKLDIYIVTINSNVTKFNAYVKNLVEALAARGQKTTDLLTNLFKGYHTTSDETFTKYIERKQEAYEEGSSELSPDTLMELANNRYKSLVETEAWNAPSEMEEKLIALETQLGTMKKKFKPTQKGKGELNNKPKRGPKKDSKKKKPCAIPDWMKKPPPASLAKIPVKIGDKEYYWCHASTGGKCGGVWRRHKPSECKGISAATAKPESARMQLKKALEARINQADSSDEE